MKVSRNSAFLFLLPSLAILLSITVFPLVYSLWLSFNKWEMLLPGARPSVVGISNYIKVFTNARFIASLKYTSTILIIALPSQLILGIGIALLLAKDIKGRSFFLSLILLPMVIAPVVIGSVSRMVFNELYGPVNYLLSMLHFNKLSWLSVPSLAKSVIILTDIWEWTPFVVLVVFAGLQALPQEPYQAARVDGATNWQLFVYLTLPFLKRHLITVLFIRALWIFTLYDIVYVVTKGGPGTSTETVSFYTYLVGFKYFSLGMAAAMSYVVLGCCIILVTFFVRVAFK